MNSPRRTSTCPRARPANAPQSRPRRHRRPLPPRPRRMLSRRKTQGRLLDAARSSAGPVALLPWVGARHRRGGAAAHRWGCRCARCAAPSGTGDQVRAALELSRSVRRAASFAAVTVSAPSVGRRGRWGRHLQPVLRVQTVAQTFARLDSASITACDDRQVTSPDDVPSTALTDSRLKRSTISRRVYPSPRRRGRSLSRSTSKQT